MSVSVSIEEEYKIWRKNVPYLYDLMYSNVLDTNTFTIQWFRDSQRTSENMTRQRLLMSGSHDLGDRKVNYFYISELCIPDIVDEDSVSSPVIRFKPIQTIPTPIEINKLRYCPSANNIIACKTDESPILVYDFTKHSWSNSERGPDEILHGHNTGGFALEWNPNRFGELGSAGRDCMVNIFNINNGLTHSSSIHTEIVNDISFSMFNPSIFASVSDDMQLVVHDTRYEGPSVVKQAHSMSIESCCFSPFRGELLATTSSDCSVKVWDTRNLNGPINTMRGHSKSVMNVKWSPHYESILATSSKDRRVIIWDLNKKDEDVSDFSSEVLFVHGGHTEVVDDFDWNTNEPMEIASVSSDAVLNVWKIPLEKFIN